MLSQVAGSLQVRAGSKLAEQRSEQDEEQGTQQATYIIGPFHMLILP